MWIDPKEKAKLEYEKWKKAGNKPISDYEFDLEVEVSSDRGSDNE